MSDLTLTQRELDEIELAMYYDARLSHGTAGHNRLLLIAKLAKALGFEYLAASHNYVFPPDGVAVEKPSGVAEVEISGQKHGVVLTEGGGEKN